MRSTIHPHKSGNRGVYGREISVDTHIEALYHGRYEQLTNIVTNRVFSFCWSKRTVSLESVFIFARVSEHFKTVNLRATI